MKVPWGDEICHFVGVAHFGYPFRAQYDCMIGGEVVGLAQETMYGD